MRIGITGAGIRIWYFEMTPSVASEDRIPTDSRLEHRSRIGSDRLTVRNRHTTPCEDHSTGTASATKITAVSVPLFTTKTKMRLASLSTVTDGGQKVCAAGAQAFGMGTNAHLEQVKKYGIVDSAAGRYGRDISVLYEKAVAKHIDETKCRHFGGSDRSQGYHVDK